MTEKDEQNEMNEQREFQEKVLAYRILESRLNSLAQQRELITNKLIEIQTTLNSIDEIEKSKEEVLFPLGSEAYAFGKVADKTKMIVEVGAGVALEKTVGEAKEILKSRMTDIENALTTVQRNMQEASESLEVLEPELQQMMEKQQRHEHRDEESTSHLAK